MFLGSRWLLTVHLVLLARLLEAAVSLLFCALYVAVFRLYSCHASRLSNGLARGSVPKMCPACVLSSFALLFSPHARGQGGRPTAPTPRTHCSCPKRPPLFSTYTPANLTPSLQPPPLTGASWMPEAGTRPTTTTPRFAPPLQVCSRLGD